MKKLSTKDFITKSKEKHGDKYDYSESVYVDSRSKVKIICPEHGPFFQNPQSHYTGSECPICAKLNRVISRLGTVDQIKENFINKSNKIHNNKYSYEKVIYKDSETKVCIMCPIHGEFLQIPNDHSQGHGCPKCSNLKRRSDISNKIHIDLSEYIIKDPITLSGNSKIIGSIYIFINSLNNKKYIGKTISKLSSRFSAHFSKSKTSNFYFYRAIRKYGWDKFDKYVIFQTEVLDNSEENKKLLNSIICDKEIEFIKLFNTTDRNFGYNETEGGEGISGKNFSTETKLKMSESRKGQNNPMYGKTLEKNPKSIPILQLDLEGNIIKRWSCAVEINKELGYSISMIRGCYNGKYQKYKNCKWIKEKDYLTFDSNI